MFMCLACVVSLCSSRTCVMQNASCQNRHVFLVFGTGLIYTTEHSENIYLIVILSEIYRQCNKTVSEYKTALLMLHGEGQKCAYHALF